MIKDIRDNVAGGDGHAREADAATGHRSADGVGAYVSLLEALPAENAIVRRFVGAAHMLTRAALVNTMFALARAFDFTWEESVKIVGDTLSLSRSSVAREMRDMERLVDFWNGSGFSLVEVEEAVARFTAQVERRLKMSMAWNEARDD